MGEPERYVFSVARRCSHYQLCVYPGAWLIHLVLILGGKMVLDTVPGMSQQMSWTFLNLLYLSVRLSTLISCCSMCKLYAQITTLVFHWATGIPFQSYLHGGAYDDLTLWEQIDEGAQYTPAKKWLISAPIVLYVFVTSYPNLPGRSYPLRSFLVSTHYTQYNPWIFAINVTALVMSLVPKLPQVCQNIRIDHAILIVRVSFIVNVCAFCLRTKSRVP
jgi:hypothetical protein